MAAPSAVENYEDVLFLDPPPEQSPKRPPTALKQPHRSGHKCEFVERPPSDGLEPADGACPVCSLVLREPHQVTCCGYTVCQSCIQVIQEEQRLCPSCNQKFTAFADKRLKRSLYARKVSCSQRGAGCEWVGKLGELDEHLNLQPLPDKLLVGCQFSEVECSNCMQPFQRRYVKEHQSDSCPMRPYTCQHCNKYAATFEDVTQNHQLLCPLFPLSCPNNCELVLQRQKLEHHVSRDCPLTLVQCDFHTVGCEMRVARKDLQSHISESLTEHMLLQQMRILQLQDMVAQYKNENQQLREALAASDQKLEATLTMHQKMLEEITCTGTLPFEFTMTEFEQHKRANDDWCSPPFYTHTHGYKMCIVVNANGSFSGRGTHVSVTSRLMRGDFDAALQWPFEGSITIQLLNQLEDSNHHKNVQNYGRVTDPRQKSRVTSGEGALMGPCIDTFVSHTQLALNSYRNILYLKNNELKFRVSRSSGIDPTAYIHRRCLTLESFAGAIEPQVCVAPIEFTLAKFENQKRQNGIWYSPAFYTHPQGYRMCLRVDPNGYGGGIGTHVSIYSCLMQGAFDTNLKWPLRGEVIIQIMNQAGEYNYYQRSIFFTDRTGHSNAGRVTNKERSPGLGYTQFISHSSLDYDASRGTQYLRGDCLRIRILRMKGQ